MSLELIFGPMFSGKSTELLRRWNICAEMNLRVLYVNSHLDDRTSDSFSTHNPTMTSVGKIQACKIQTLDEINPKDFDVLGIDEAQFIIPLKDPVIDLVENHNKKVIISGLDGDFERQEFGEILRLIPMCDKVDKLYPFCLTCLEKTGNVKDALFSKRVGGGSDQISVGAKESYRPVCRKCYQES